VYETPTEKSLLFTMKEVLFNNILMWMWLYLWSV